MVQNPQNRKINTPRRRAEAPNKTAVVGKILSHYDGKADETLAHAEEKIEALESLVNSDS